MQSLGTKLFNRYFPLFIFAVAMGFLEAIVVVYVRELYYPEGFRFPLYALPQSMMIVELARELSTLLMLGAVAWISGKFILRRLGVFLFIFGVWDIFYYIALKTFLNWPESLLTWDILFLIPITWVGPVLAPVICSVVMIGMAFLFEFIYEKSNIQNFKWKEIGLILTGAFIIYITFTYDFGLIILKGNFIPNLIHLHENTEFLEVLKSWTPTRFYWGIFTFGMLVILAGNFLLLKRGTKTARDA